MSMKKSRFEKSAVIAAILLASATTASTSALAAVVCGPGSNVSVPENIDGVYYNLVTGVGATSGGANAGWDVNMYLTGGTLFFFWPSSPAGSFGGVADGTGTNYAVLNSGALIDGSSTFLVSSGGGGAGPYVNWLAGSTGNYLGVRFFNETAAAVNYGWIQLDTTAPTGFPATIVSYCYEDSGAGITAGTTPVSLQSFSVD